MSSDCYKFISGITRELSVIKTSITPSIPSRSHIHKKHFQIQIPISPAPHLCLYHRILEKKIPLEAKSQGDRISPTVHLLRKTMSPGLYREKRSRRRQAEEFTSVPRTLRAAYPYRPRGEPVVWPPDASGGTRAATGKNSPGPANARHVYGGHCIGLGSVGLCR